MVLFHEQALILKPWQNPFRPQKLLKATVLQSFRQTKFSQFCSSEECCVSATPKPKGGLISTEYRSRRSAANKLEESLDSGAFKAVLSSTI